MRQMNVLLKIGELIVVQTSSTGWHGFCRQSFGGHRVDLGS